MRGFGAACGVLFLALALGGAEAQMIVEDFDSQTSGGPPAWLWWNNGSPGTALVDELTYRGAPGKSVELARTVFDGAGFGFGRNFRPIDGPAELNFYFLAESTDEEILTAVGGNNAGHQVAWWVGVGGDVGNAIGTYSESGGWNHVMDVSTDSWYGVTLEIYPASFTYDITVWQDGNPTNTATETGIAFRNGSAADTIDQIQFGNFSESTVSSTDAAFIDDIIFVGARVLEDGFESANTSGWSSSTRPRTVITTCGQIVTTDAVLNNDLTCDSGEIESAAVVVGASNITIDLGGHVITGHPVGVGIRAANVEGVTIQNGVIRDYLVGVDFFFSSTMVVRNLMVQNLVNADDQDTLSGVRTMSSEDVLVRDCFFHFLPLNHRNAVNLADSVATVDNIEVNGGGIGLDISGNTDGTDCAIINSRFIGTVHSGVLVQFTDNLRIADNVFLRSPINVEEHWPGGITGFTLEDNLIEDWYIGVYFMGGSSSIIRNNIIRDHDFRGIILGSDMDCPEPPTPDCFYATGNVVTGNTVTGNFIDLAHHPNAVGNTWENNICETWEGAEIPGCIAP
jgi:hypothetical protein